VLVKEVNWLGDLVMSLPALRAVRGAFPAARLSVLVKQELAGFFDGLRWVDEVIAYRIRPGVRGIRDRWRLVRSLAEAKYDLAIVFPKSFEAALWAALARVPERVGLATQGRAILLTLERMVVSRSARSGVRRPPIGSQSVAVARRFRSSRSRRARHTARRRSGRRNIS
jgi:ADP-heptose:LPS heptosyltransferase